MKIPLKNIFRDKYEMRTDMKSSYLAGPAKKYSVKLQSNEKQNHHRKKEAHPYDVTIFRPFQETNRYLETERTPKQYKAQQERTPTKPALRLRTDHQDNKQIRTDYTDHTPDKFRKEASTKHTTQNSTKKVRVPIQDIRRLISELEKERAEVGQLRKELQFYRAHAGDGNSNPVLRSLRV